MAHRRREFARVRSLFHFSSFSALYIFLVILFPLLFPLLKPSQTLDNLRFLVRSTTFNNKQRRGCPAISSLLPQPVSPLLKSSMEEPINSRSEVLSSLWFLSHAFVGLHCQPPTLPASPYDGRGYPSEYAPAKTLVPQLMGLFLCGPLNVQKPNLRKGDPNWIMLKPRSVLAFLLSILSQRRYRLVSFVRRLQTEENAPLLLWLYMNSLRTLPLDSPWLSDYERLSYMEKGFMSPSPNYLRTLPLESSRIISHAFNRMKKNGIMIPSPRTGGYRCFFRPYFPFPLTAETSLMHICYIRDDLHTPRSLKLRSDLCLLLQTGYKLCVELLNLHGRRGLHARENPPVMLRSCTYPLRILELNSHPSPILAFNLNQWSNNTFAQTLAKALPRVAFLAPARNKSLAPSSTPFSLMTLAIQSSLDSLLEDLLIILDLTCIKKLHSLWFKALKNPLSTNLFYHCISFMLALGNVLSSCILNFGVSSSYPCTWILL